MDDDPNRPVVVRECDNEQQAAMLCNVLLAEGLEARIVGEHTSDFRVEIPSPVQILVPQQEVKLAEKLLSDYESA